MKRIALLLVIGLGLTACDETGSVNATDIASARSKPTKHVSVTFTSDPTGAEVLIGNLSKGHTPVTVSVRANQPISYRVVAPEPYEDYDLYKPFSGTLTPSKDENVSVWITRTTAEEQATQKEAAEAKRAAAARAAEEAKQRRERELEARRVYYRIESSCRSGVDITMSNANGDTAQYDNRSNDWYYGFVPRRGQFLYLSAQNQCGSGYVTVKFVKDGTVLKENTSRGGYVIATISGRW